MLANGMRDGEEERLQNRQYALAAAYRRFVDDQSRADQEGAYETDEFADPDMQKRADEIDRAWRSIERKLKRLPKEPEGYEAQPGPLS